METKNLNCLTPVEAQPGGERRGWEHMILVYASGSAGEVGQLEADLIEMHHAQPRCQNDVKGTLRLKGGWWC